MSHTNEHPRMVKPKRKQANGNHKDLGACVMKPPDCYGFWLREVPQMLRKGDKLCPDCSKAHTALLRRNEHWDWRYL